MTILTYGDAQLVMPKLEVLRAWERSGRIPSIEISQQPKDRLREGYLRKSFNSRVARNCWARAVDLGSSRPRILQVQGRQ